MAAFALLCVMLNPQLDIFAAADGRLEIRIVDGEGRPLACRVYVIDSVGKPHRPKNLTFWRDHFVCDGSVDLTLTGGNYTIEIERGPEYERLHREVSVPSSGAIRWEAPLKRIADMSGMGWYSGDLHVHRPIEDIPLLMRAEDLHVAPVITWWNQTNLWTSRPPPMNPLIAIDADRYFHMMAGEDEREGGALLFFHLKRPLPIANATREYPSPMTFVEAARRSEGAWIDIEKPFWWDVPVWLACARPDSIGIANNHMCRDSMYEGEAWGKPRDVQRLPPPLGNGYWSQEIYYHILNCGLRIPPSAGSASGVLPSPVGYNRVYVFTDQRGKLSDERAWWEGLRAGRSFVTNGPLLVVRAAGQLAGHVFRARQGQTLDIPISADVVSNDKARKLEVIRDGEIAYTIALPETSSSSAADRPGTRLAKSDLGHLRFKSSGWFLVRAIADNPRTFRFASTAPFYVEIGDKPRRISRASAQFFLEWINERAKRVGRRLKDPAQRREVLIYHDRARMFWKDKVATANAP